jgi:putative nucleotidyltransferase with HDIG domain
MITANGALADRLSRALEEVRVSRPAAVRVLLTLDNPNANAQLVANAVEGDPMLTVQVMKLANSAFYGLSGRVGSASMAVSVIGFAAVRSLSAVTAAGLSDPEAVVPEGFWDHAALTAAAASILAPTMGAAKGDALAAGLLHDLGSALFLRAAPEIQLPLVASYGSDTASLCDHESQTYGVGHDNVAAKLLSSWRFPIAIVDAIANHHAPVETNAPLVHAVSAADAVATALAAPASDDVERLAELCGLSGEQIEQVLEQTRDRASGLAASLPNG